jgi:hypothetical protein
MQKSVDQDQMQMLAAIPEEEANRLSLKLMKENFLKIKELKKGTSNVGPVKFFNLFHVDLPEVMKIFGIFMSRVIGILPYCAGCT